MRTNEERIAQLEKHVRNFKIITAGNGEISGGFGRLPPSEDIGERLANLEKAIAKFTLSGNNVQVSGSFDSGYVLN